MTEIDASAPDTLAAIVGRLDARGAAPALAVLDRDALHEVAAATLAGDARRRRAALAVQGVARGERVALFAPADATWLAAALGVLEHGATLVPIDAQLDGDTLAHVITDAAPALIWTTPDGRERIAALALAATPPVALLADALPDAAGAQATMPRAEDAAVLFYTSGTTGPPKGVPLSHHRLCWQIARIREAALVQADDRVLLPLPLHHVYPLVVGALAPLALGVPIVLPFALTGPQVRRALLEARVSVVIGVPRLYAALSDGLERRLTAHGLLLRTLARGSLSALTALRRHLGWRMPRRLLVPLRRRLGGRLRLLASGGAALDPMLAWRFEALGFDVATGYGLTETAPLLTLNAPGQARFDTAGRALPGVEIRSDKDGEVLVRGPAVFTGYHNLPEKTAEAFAGDWFRTGDLGELDDDGYLHLHGRRSTRIVTASGETLQPDAIEDAYATHPLLEEVAVLERDGRLVMLAVPAAAAVRDAKDANGQVREAVRERARTLPSHHAVTEVAVTREALPRTRLGKLRRHLIAARFDAALSEGAAAEPERHTAPLALADMASADRELLDDPAARAAWDELAERFADRGLRPESDLVGDLGIDSLAWLDLGLAIESRAGIELDEAVISEAVTVRDLLTEIAAAGGGSAIDPFADPEAVLSDAQRAWLEPLGPGQRRIARAALALDRAFFAVLGGVRGNGLEALPARPPFVIVANHRSYLDAPALVAALPEALLEQTHFAAASDAAFVNPVLRALSRLAQAVPLDPARRVVSSLALGAAVLGRGRNLVWFPEGGISRSGELQAFRPGLGRILAHHDVAVVPMWIEGTQRALPPGRHWPHRARVTVTCGAPATRDTLLAEGSGASDDARIASALRARVEALAPAR